MTGEFIKLVSSAKRGGGIDALYPDRDPRKAPWHLVTAVNHALSVLSWMELPDESQPPEQIWLNPEALNAHFERISREAKGSGGREPVEQVPMMENEYTSSLRR